MNRLSGTTSSRDALQTPIEWKVFPEGKLAPTDPPLTTETCLQTIRLLAGQLIVYTDGSATAGTRDGGTGVIGTDPVDPTILDRSHLRGAAFTSSFAEEAAAMQLALEWASTNHPEHSQSVPTVNRYSRQLNVDTRAQRNQVNELADTEAKTATATTSDPSRPIFYASKRSLI